MQQAAFHRAATTGRADSQDAERLVFSPKGHGGLLAESSSGGMPHSHRTASGGGPGGAKRGSSGRQRYRACECALLVLLATCIALSFLRFHAHIRNLEAMEGDAPVIDVVGVSLKPSCVTRQAVASLNLYLKPRTIHVVTTSAAKCRIYNSFASNVDCHIQDAFLPGVTTDAIGDYIRDHIGVDEHKEFKGRQLSGWYMQQFAKLGAALALPGLTEHFVVWDLDMVLLQPVQVLFPASGGPGAQTLVNVGGSMSKGYASSFRKLLRSGLDFAPDGSSFVTHWMVVYRPYMLEFLTALSAGGDGGPTAWVWRILSAVDARSAELGFSEYASYISWVRQHHPQSQRFAPRKTWVRHPFGQTTVRLLRHLRPDGCCCPSWLLLKVVKALGFVYTGYEVGHIAECQYSVPQYALSYGLGPAASAADGGAGPGVGAAVGAGAAGAGGAGAAGRAGEGGDEAADEGAGAVDPADDGGPDAA